MSLVLLAIGLEAYQVVAHVHCMSGRTLPESHRSTLGFAGAILADALCYLLSCIALVASSGATWAWLLLPLVAHLFYFALVLFFRPFYLRIHDYRRSTIYMDGSFCRSKRIAGVFDTAFHLFALALLIAHARAPEALYLTAVGVAAYWFVFTPSVAPAPVASDKHA